MDSALQFLFDIIHFDMQQIQNYREAIFNIAVAIVVASFGISAFIYSKDSILTPVNKSSALIGANIILLLVLIAVTYLYDFKGLNFSRAALELREEALTSHIFEGKSLTIESLYPHPPANYEPKIESLLERIPLYLAIIVIFIKAIVESILLKKILSKSAQQPNPADT